MAGDFYPDDEACARMTKTPIWTGHSTNDHIVPVSSTDGMVAVSYTHLVNARAIVFYIGQGLVEQQASLIVFYRCMPKVQIRFGKVVEPTDARCV